MKKRTKKERQEAFALEQARLLELEEKAIQDLGWGHMSREYSKYAAIAKDENRDNFDRSRALKRANEYMRLCIRLGGKPAELLSPEERRKQQTSRESEAF